MRAKSTRINLYAPHLWNVDSLLWGYFMTVQFPEVKHVYQNDSTLDSTRWQHYTPHADDIIVATAPKCGTTWMQNIVMHLIFQDLQFRPVFDIFPWLDVLNPPIDEVIAKLDAQEHRRSLKTHLPLDGLVYHPQVKYIVVCRDARDAFMSLYNHLSNTLDTKNEPPFLNDIREFWRLWMTKGAFEWQSEGYPIQGNLHHTQTWWDFRHLPNILFVHYNNLLQDLEGEIRRVASYLDIHVADDLFPKIVDAVSFKTMNENADKVAGDFSWLNGGVKTFIYKGTNGRWRDVLTKEDLQLYEAAVKRELTPDCAYWLEHGRLQTQG